MSRRPGWRIGRKIGASDGDQPTTGSETGKAERRCRAVASVLRPSTLATAENGRFIRIRSGAARTQMIVDLCSVENE